MRVVLSPGAEARARGLDVAEALAGSKVGVAVLSRLGARNLRRPLSRAEVQVVRGALQEAEPFSGPLLWPPVAAGDELLVGYVCAGRALPGGCPAGVRSVVVTDHVDLTWRSPLTGPNDGRFGPRFPVVAGVYRPETVRVAPEGGSLLGVVAGVRDDRRLTVFEAGVVVRHGIQAVSSELVAVSIVAAHMGLRVAAIVVVDGVCEMPTGAYVADGASKGLERSG
jgi:hypothetical protein